MQVHHYLISSLLPSLLPSLPPSLPPSFPPSLFSSPSPPLPQTFKCSADDLKEESELGRGAYGSVYQMRHKQTSTVMAVKVCGCVWVCGWVCVWVCGCVWVGELVWGVDVGMCECECVQEVNVSNTQF